jgi:glycosyltransferase involved in cell wall biosynthesis
VRIALLDPPSYSPAYDHHLATSLAGRGHEVDLLTSPFAHGDPPTPNGYRRAEIFLPWSSKLLRRAPRSRLRYVLKGAEYVPSVGRLLRTIGVLEPDVVHVQWLARPRADLRWVERLRRRRPVVLTAHNVLPHEGEADPAQRRALYAAFDRVVVHTASGAERLVELGVPAERIVRIPHGTFDSPNELEPPSGTTVLFFGLIRRYKGLDTLVRALPGVPEARLVVAGDPLDPVEPVQRLAAELGVDDRIEWRLGYLPADEVETLMQEAAITAFPYRSGESASGALSTALGHGRPAVVTEVLGEPVREYEAGLVVPPEDPERLAEAIARLLRDPAELERVYRGTKRAREALSWSAVAEAHERLYSELVARVPAG